MFSARKRYVFYGLILGLYLLTSTNFETLIAAKSPMVALKQIVPGHPFYPIRNLREQLQEKLVFGNYDKTLWYLNLANKRGNEASILFDRNEFKSSLNSLLVASNELNTSKPFYKKAVLEEDPNYLNIRMKEVSGKLLEISNTLKPRLSDDSLKLLQSIYESLNQTI